VTAESFLVFLDANVLARPVTRTLLLLSGPPSGFAPVWSATVEAEADRHLRPRQKPVAELRPGWGTALTPTGSNAVVFAATSPNDRQVLADAAAAGALFLVTDNVADFAATDLARAGIAAVGPDLFLSERTTRAGYREAIEWLSTHMTSPRLTAHHRTFTRRSADGTRACTAGTQTRTQGQQAQ
jgi:hypothetical protein